ncbi:MAG: hypothetical protein JEZ00_17065 [Anaerolineaceae bacterium]|nr:hypothetical protein [Anaerolineaceae bacterium]
MEDPMLTNEGQLESGESQPIETQELDTATYEPMALVEQSGDYERAEAIQTAVETLIDSDMVDMDQVEYEPGHPPSPPDLDHNPPDFQAEDKSILGSMPKVREDLDQLEPTGSDDDREVEPTPITLPGKNDELSATPITLPGKTDDVSATPINLPNTIDEVSATSINTPEQVPPLDLIQDPEIQTQSQDLREPIRELDVQMPEHGLKQPGEDMDIGKIMDDFSPGKGTIIGPDGKSIGGSIFGTNDMFGEDIGMGQGGPQDLNNATAPDKNPGTDGVFTPGGGSNSAVMEVLHDDKLQNYLANEKEEKAKQGRREELYQMQSEIVNPKNPVPAGKKPVPQATDDEDPPPTPPSKPSNNNDRMEGGSGEKSQSELRSKDGMTTQYDSDQISMTTPDGSKGVDTGGSIQGKNAEKVEDALNVMKKVLATEKKMGSELITDPSEHDPKGTQGKMNTAKN